jgi:hypothetical protein
MTKKNFSPNLYPWKPDIDYRKTPEQYPEQYKVGKGEQGVLLCEPYKGEILPFWRFKTPEMAQESSEKIYALFLKYLENKDFICADMARKFLQMGFTRARRYTNYKGGKKYHPLTRNPLEKVTGSPLKAESAQIFFKKWKEAEEHPVYKQQKIAWKSQLG